jgi:LmbE family N-acetylglucosaminyl deacetylase
VVAELLTEIPTRALAIYAHPDDPDVSCGGTLAAWAKAGCEVGVVLCTDGGKGTMDPDMDSGALVQLRVAEATEAAAMIGVGDQQFLNNHDGELVDDAAFREVLVGLVRRFRPDVVLCPDPTAIFFGQEYFNHRDHRVTGLAVLDAIAPAASLPHYFPAAGPAHQVSTILMSGTLEPDVWVDISSTVDVKGEAVGCHRSQFRDGVEWASTAVRLAAEDAGKQAGVDFAEGFRRLRLGG